MSGMVSPFDCCVGGFYGWALFDDVRFCKERVDASFLPDPFSSLSDRYPILSFVTHITNCVDWLADRAFIVVGAVAPVLSLLAHTFSGILSALGLVDAQALYQRVQLAVCPPEIKKSINRFLLATAFSDAAALALSVCLIAFQVLGLGMGSTLLVMIVVVDVVAAVAKWHFAPTIEHKQSFR